jgi:hypothetical protein
MPNSCVLCDAEASPDLKLLNCDQCKSALYGMEHWSPTSTRPTIARAGQWAIYEDRKLKKAVLAHGDKNWKTIAALVPGRTRSQCSSRWHDALDPTIGRATARACHWTADEDKMLKNAVRAHGGKNWEAIAALVSGRTKVQCRTRWHDFLDCNIDPAPTEHISNGPNLSAGSRKAAKRTFPGNLTADGINWRCCNRKMKMSKR